MILAVLTLCAATAQAQSPINGIGLSVGVVNVENAQNSSLGFGMFADLGLPAVPFSVQPYVDYWSNSEDMNGGELTARDIAVGARSLYHLPLPALPVKPFLSAGLGMHFMRAETPSFDFGGTTFPSVTASDTKLGVDLGGGIGYELGSVEIRGEGYYTFISDASNLVNARASVVLPFGL
jgi:hypothetical protein